MIEFLIGQRVRLVDPDIDPEINIALVHSKDERGLYNLTFIDGTMCGGYLPKEIAAI
jgi:hypothetical protein